MTVLVALAAAAALTGWLPHSTVAPRRSMYPPPHSALVFRRGRAVSCAEPDMGELARRIEQQKRKLRDAEQRETERRRADLEDRTDLSAEGKAARRLSDDVAKQEPALLPHGPSPDLSPHDVVVACMVALQESDVPEEVERNGVDWGHRYQWKFFNGMVRANWGGDVDEFVREEKNNPNGLANCDWFETDEESISHIPGTPTRGAIAKMVVAVRCRDGVPMESRKFLWTLQQERRPPQTGCWLISSVLAMDRALDQLTM